MSSSGLTPLLAISFILFTTVTAYVPSWIVNDYKFHCEQICSEHLKGETYSCFSGSGYGLAAGSVIVRFLPNFDWRYYAIHEGQKSNNICKHILVADEFYSQGNKTVCSPIFPKRNYFVNIGLRSSGAKTNPDISKMEKLIAFLGNITRLANEIQKEVMVVDETNQGDNPTSSKTSNGSDERTKRVLPLLGMLAGGLSGVGSILTPGKSNNVENVNNIVVSQPPAAPVHETNFVEKYYLRSSYGDNEKDHLTGGHDPRSDAICYWVSKDMCRRREMVICVNDICCWTTLNSDPCYLTMNDNGFTIYRQNIYSIIKALNLK